MGEEYRPAYADSLVTAFSTQEDADRGRLARLRHVCRATCRRHAYITLNIVLFRLVSPADVPRIIAIERLTVASVFVGQ